MMDPYSFGDESGRYLMLRIAGAVIPLHIQLPILFVSFLVFMSGIFFWFSRVTTGDVDLDVYISYVTTIKLANITICVTLHALFFPAFQDCAAADSASDCGPERSVNRNG